MILDFYRDKLVEVEPAPDGRLLVSWRLSDTFTRLEVRMAVTPPGLEISELAINFTRGLAPGCARAARLAERLTGVRVGPGLRKIAAGLAGGETGCGRVVEAVLEAANAVILHYTMAQLKPGDKLDDAAKLAGARAMLEANPRMARSCVVYSDDSPVVTGAPWEG